MSKDNIFVLIKILTERKSATQNMRLWELLQKDLEYYITANQLDLKDLALVLDSYYKLGIAESSHNQFIVNHITKH